MDDSYPNIRKLLKEHHALFAKSIPLVASENVTSHAVREAEITDFGHRYAEGWPGERLYAGCKYIDQVELSCMRLAKDVFNCSFADVRPTSGVSANLVIYSAFTDPGDTMMVTPIPKGGHISHAPKFTKSGKYLGGTAGNVHGLNIEYFAFDAERMNIDVAASEERMKSIKPKMILFGASVFLFPHPVRELSKVAKDLGCRVGYDAAHVAGLIAGGCFQQPLKEGAEVISASTHKTLPGPQHGIVLADSEEVGELIKNTTFPSIVSNHHCHNVAALAVALAECKKFGKAYATQVIRNAKALARALDDAGFTVCAKNHGFTESHTVLVDVTPLEKTVGLGGDVERKLEAAGIILNRNLLPDDNDRGRHYSNPGGVRIGTSEITRLGMKEAQMKQVAGFIKEVVLEGRKPEKVAREVAAFRKKYSTIKYCFGKARDAYKYVSLTQ